MSHLIPEGYIVMCQVFIMLRLMVAYEGLLEILHHDLKTKHCVPEVSFCWEFGQRRVKVFF